MIFYMQVIVDASVIIDYIRRKAPESSFYIQLTDRKDQIVLSLVTVAELYSGSSAHKRGRSREILEKILTGAEISIPTLKDAVTAGKLRAEYQLSLGDAFIAELAIRKKYPLATLDRKAFGKIARLKLYSHKK